MLNKGMELTAIKKQMQNKYSWWKLSEEREFSNGETNLYYKDGNSMVVFFFDGNLRLRDTSHLEYPSLAE